MIMFKNNRKDKRISKKKSHAMNDKVPIQASSKSNIVLVSLSVRRRNPVQQI